MSAPKPLAALAVLLLSLLCSGCRYFLAPMVDADKARAAWAWTRSPDGGQATVSPADAGWVNGTSTIEELPTGGAR